MPEFLEGRKREWYLHISPFTFFIYDTDGQSLNERVDIVWRYSESTGQHQANSLNEAKLWCYQFMLTSTLKQLQEIAPIGGRTEIIDGQYKFICNGSIPDMGYRCCLDIGHSGLCYTQIKKVHFEREN